MWAELVLVWGYASVGGVSFVWGYVSVGGVSFIQCVMSVGGVSLVQCVMMWLRCRLLLCFPAVCLTR